MHRKTARRIYEPYFIEKYENISGNELKKVLSEYYTSKDLVILKKKFSQSGRPAKKVLTPPFFIIMDDDILENELKNIRASYSKISFAKSENVVFCPGYSDLTDAVKKTIDEQRVLFGRFKSDYPLEKELFSLFTSDVFKDISNIIMPFCLTVYCNETGRKFIKRY
jgi:hypothetical protein